MSGLVRNCKTLFKKTLIDFIFHGGEGAALLLPDCILYTGRDSFVILTFADEPLVYPLFSITFWKLYVQVTSLFCNLEYSIPLLMSF